MQLGSFVKEEDNVSMQQIQMEIILKVHHMELDLRLRVHNYGTCNLDS